MNVTLDHIRRIQTQLAEIPCRVCRRQGLVLLLRYDRHKGRCLLMAFCKACQLKDPVDPDSERQLNLQDFSRPGTIPAIVARR